MTINFRRAMTRATACVRSQNLAEATAIIQAALAGHPAREAHPAPAPASGTRRLAAEIEDVETIDGRPVAPPGSEGRRSLRDVVALLRRGGQGLAAMPLPGSSRAPAVPLPEGASFTWRSHACAAGSRRYRLFVPSCGTTELRGLVIMLHGCKQDPDDFAAGTGMNGLAEELRMIVAYPEQPVAANVSGCWNWFDPGHQGRDVGEPAILATLAGDLVAEFSLPADRVYAAGLSAGGAMAAVLAETYPDVFAAVGIHSGLPHGSARDVASAFAAMRGQGLAATDARGLAGPRVIVFHGSADRTVHPANAAAIVERLPQVGDGTVETGTTSGRAWRRTYRSDGDGVPEVEVWLIEGGGHAWSGGDASGSFADPAGPSASAEMLRFFTAEGR